MTETQTKVGDKIITKKKKEPIPEGCIHIYLGKKIGIGISRKFLTQLKELGMKKWKRTSKMKYDHPDMSAHATIIDNFLNVSIYTDDMPDMRTKLHNFMLVGFDKDFEEEIRKRFPAMARAKITNMRLVGPSRDARVFRMEFNLDEAEIVGQIQTDARDEFV